MKMLPAIAASFLLAAPAWSQEAATAYLRKHCLECHGPDEAKAGFRVDQLDISMASKPSEERWRTVLERVTAGEMPPKKKARPPAEETQAALAWIRERVTAAESARRAAQGRVVLRRLNRTEYTRTVGDLLGIEYDLRETLALDGSVDGFDNVGSGLHLSSFALERYLEAADIALNLAIVNRPAPAPMKKRYSLKNQHAVRTYKEDFFRTLEDGTVVCFLGTHDGRVHLSEFWPPDRGLFRFRIAASGYQSQGKPMTFEASGGSGLVGYFDVPADTPTVVEFVTRVEMTRTGPTSISILPYGVGNAVYQVPGKAAKYEGPGVAIHWIEAEGPLNEGWPPASHRGIFGDLAQAPIGPHRRLEVVSKDPAGDAERILRAFLPRAIRRKVSEEDLRPYIDLVRFRLEEKDSFEQAVRVGLSAALASPAFLFLDEKPGLLDDYALASRLSYFFWSTMPDEELFALAEARKLSAPDTLRAQVERMLRSPKADAFTKNFLGQWLGLRDIDFTAPHYYLYPEFDPMLKVSMVRETEAFFAELLKEDLSVLNVVSSDFSILNGRLARHYGIPGVDGLWEFRKVALPPESHRGGVLTMASVLKVTADGTNTSPIKRGAWVLDRILGTPPPKPPADVPPLEPDIRGARTLREQLAKHRSQPACASCHAQIDPPGWALESFDVIGGWREYYRTATWAKGVKEVKGHRYLRSHDVDPSAETADGERFQNVDDLKRILLRNPDQIARSLARKIATYATGGPPEGADQEEIEAILGRIRPKNYGLRTLVHEIVQSRMFRTK
jgi:mono/diheme cytochrome c family protein